MMVEYWVPSAITSTLLWPLLLLPWNPLACQPNETHDRVFAVSLSVPLGFGWPVTLPAAIIGWIVVAVSRRHRGRIAP